MAENTDEHEAEQRRLRAQFLELHDMTKSLYNMGMYKDASKIAEAAATILHQLSYSVRRGNT